MKQPYFQALEAKSEDITLELDAVIEQLIFNEQGLIPVITQDSTSKDVLMFAWMNEEALRLTLSTKKMTYWSRSRKALWLKGETSGNYQALVAMSFDCDGDVILCEVEQRGGACHTGRQNCFYLSVDVDHSQVFIPTHKP